MTPLEIAEIKHRSRKRIPYYKRCQKCEKVLDDLEGIMLPTLRNLRVCQDCHDKLQYDNAKDKRLKLF